MTTRIWNVQQLFQNLNTLTHIEVKRPMGYFHHYIVIKEESLENNYLTIVHYTGGLKEFVSEETAGKIKKTCHSIQDVEKDIENGLYIISTPEYPRTFQEFCEASVRWLKRLGESFYHAAYNNCEHFARYVMTGFASSEQVKNANLAKKVIIDTVDAVVSDGKANLSKTLLSGAKNIISSGLTKVNKLNSASPKLAPVLSKAYTGAKNVISTVISKVPSKVKEIYDCARNTTGKVVSKLGSTTIISTAIESASLLYEWRKLRGLKMGGIIAQSDYNSEMIKKAIKLPFVVTGAFIGTAFGGSVGGVLGHGIGTLIGSVVGGMFGKLFG